MKSFLKAALGVAVLLLALLYVFVLGARLYGRAFTRSLRDVFRALLGFHAAQAYADRSLFQEKETASRNTSGR